MKSDFVESVCYGFKRTCKAGYAYVIWICYVIKIVVGKFIVTTILIAIFIWCTDIFAHLLAKIKFVVV